MFWYFCFGKAALDHLVQRTDIDTSRIVIFGRSLGGAVGAVLAKNNPDKVYFYYIFHTVGIINKFFFLTNFLRVSFSYSFCFGLQLCMASCKLLSLFSPVNYICVFLFILLFWFPLVKFHILAFLLAYAS